MVELISSGKNIWVLAEYEEQELRDVTLELLSEARRLADKLGDELCTVIAGENVPLVTDKLGQYGTDRVYQIACPPAEDSVDRCSQAISDLIREQAPRMLLCGHTPMGRDIAVRSAAALGAGLVADCITLGLSDDGQLQYSKTVLAGKAIATVLCTQSSFQVATVAPGVFDMKRARTPKKADLVRIVSQLHASTPCPKVVDQIEADIETLTLEEAPVIVAGGRGVGNRENFAMLERLAELLRGVTGGSRMAVDAGYVPTSKQIGQTGKRVSPRFYLACAISGSSYHTIGMKDSKIIAAINKDPNALIFKLADVGMVGDVLEIVPAIIDELKALIPADKGQ